jgi:hypothetical protein
MPRTRQCTNPEDRRFWLWVRPSILIGIAVAILAVVLASIKRSDLLGGFEREVGEDVHAGFEILAKKLEAVAQYRNNNLGPGEKRGSDVISASAVTDSIYGRVPKVGTIGTIPKFENRLLGPPNFP